MPLTNTTVLEDSRTIHGAMCGRLLAELGAEVIMVEPPGGHPLRTVSDDPETAAHYFETVGVGKRSVVVDADADGIAIDLLEAADVLVTDRVDPGSPFDEQTATEHNPDLVYCSVTPFGRRGPSRNEAADDLVVQATTGISDTTGFPEGPPAATAAPVGATFGAFAGCGAVIAALLGDAPDRSIDVSLQDSLLPLLTTLLPEYFATSEPVTRSGNQHPITAPWNAYRAADGWVFIIAYTDRDWEQFARLIDRPELIDDERFSSVGDRRTHAETIDEIFRSWVDGRSVADVIETFDREDLTAVAIADVDEAFDDANLEHRGMLVESNEHAIAGSVFALSESPGDVASPAPALDERGGGT